MLRCMFCYIEIHIKWVKSKQHEVLTKEKDAMLSLLGHYALWCKHLALVLTSSCSLSWGSFSIIEIVGN